MAGDSLRKAAHMITDSKDRFIVEHYRSMTQPEIADKLGVDKSTVSRRVARLRADGDIGTAVDEAARKESIEARRRLQGCAMGRADRLEALAELKDMLHAEIAMSGGQSLARVSSEYRKTLEELEAISTELDIAVKALRQITPVQVARLKSELRGKHQGEMDDDELFGIVDEVLGYLNDNDILSYTPLARLRSNAELRKNPPYNEIDAIIAEGQLEDGLPIDVLEDDD